jgi:methionine-rich copper-binding protein CopC
VVTPSGVTPPAAATPVSVVLPLLAVLGVVGVVGVLLVAGGWFGPGVAPAAAHSRLVRSVPADGSTVATPPRQIRLRFNEDVMEIGVVVRVAGPQGEVGSGTASVNGRTVTRDLAGDLPAGRYLVGWRVTSADGHPLSGSVRFTARKGSDAPPGTTSPGSGTVTPSSGTRSATGAPAAGEDSREATDRTSGDPLGGLKSSGTSAGISGTVLALGVVLAGLGVGAVALGLRRRLGPPPESPPPGRDVPDQPITDRTREADDS